MKTKIYPADKVRIHCLKEFEEVRDIVLQEIIKKSNQNEVIDFLKNTMYCDHVMKNKVELENFIKVCSGIILSHIANFIGITNADIISQLNLSANIYDNNYHAFHFDDKQLVKDIVASRFSKVPMSEIKNPFEFILIGLPYRMNYSDDGKNKFDVISIAHSLVCDLDNDYEEIYAWRILFIDTEGKYAANSIEFVTEDYTHVDEKGFVNKDKNIPISLNKEDKNVAKMFLLVCKFLAFLSTPSCTTKEVYRRAKKKSSAEVKKSFRRMKMITMDKKNTKYNYEDDIPSGRKLTARTHVIGHFKTFTKGKLAGRILWCPPHWKGPKIGEVVHSDHLVK